MNGKRSLVFGALIGAILTAPLIAAMHLGRGWAGWPFAPFDSFDWLTRVLPGGLTSTGLELMLGLLRGLGVSVAENAKTAERLLAVATFLAAGAAAGAGWSLVLRTRAIPSNAVGGVLVAAFGAAATAAIRLALEPSSAPGAGELAWTAALFLAWGLTFVRVFRRLNPVGTPVVREEPEIRSVERIDRRQFIVRVGWAAASVTVVGAVVGEIASRARRGAERSLGSYPPLSGREREGYPRPHQNDPVTPAPGTRPEYTPLERHYRVFIRSEATVIDGARWRLPVTGLVDRPLSLTWEEIKGSYPARHHYVTLSCISNEIGGDLIGTTLWTGASLRDILASAGLQPSARYLEISSGDGYHETVDLDLIAQDPRIMLCYAWDGRDLTVDHGYPLRIWLPDRYGMKQPKWITGLVATDLHRKGYWVERGWDEDAQVRTVSVIDTIAVEDAFGEGGRTLVPVGGIAYSGDRGISRIEVRTDDGPWEEARIRSPLSPESWVIWRYDWPLREGRHTLFVRCFEGDGTPQIANRRPVYPSGATGIDSRRAGA